MRNNPANEGNPVFSRKRLKVVCIIARYRAAPIALALALALVSSVPAQTWSVATPESVGMSPERLDRIAVAIDREIEQGKMPGGVLAITRHGKLVYHEAFGYQDRENGIPMPRDAIFSISSLTKPVVAVAALTLHEQGKLLLNESIASYIPELEDMQVAVNRNPSETEPARRQPTVEDLFLHTSGFTNEFVGSTELHSLYPPTHIWPDELTGDEFVDVLAQLPLHNQPGTTWDYSYGFDLLAVMIERLSGKSHAAYLEEEIFAPLGMTDTSFSIPANKASRHVKPLSHDPLTGEPQSTIDHSKRVFDCGQDCLTSTVLDYLAFAQMLMNRGEFNGQRILGPRTVDNMTADHAGPDVDLSILYDIAALPNDGYGFGLGVAVRRETGLGGTMASPGEYQWYGATGTLFRVDPAEGLVIVWMAHTPGEIRGVNRQLIPTLVYQALID